MRSSRVVAAVALAVLVGSTALAAPAPAHAELPPQPVVDPALDPANPAPAWVGAEPQEMPPQPPVDDPVAPAPAPAVPGPSWPMPAGADSSLPEAYATSVLDPTRNPAGANDWTCKPSATHPYPVVLLHGTWESAYSSWNGLSRIIKYQGYCVYALNYGNSTGVGWLNATGDMFESNREIAAFVDQVLAATGAQKVDLLGRAQGGTQARYYANLVGGTAKVNQVIAIGASNHPTTLSGMTTVAKDLNVFGAAMDLLEAIRMPAAAQQADQTPEPQSPFYQQLNGNGETIPGMKYTNFLTRYDVVVTPYTAAGITAGPGATVNNITIQDVCAQDGSDHLSLPYSKNVAQIVLNKLDPKDQRQIRCYVQTPVDGNTLPVG